MSTQTMGRFDEKYLSSQGEAVASAMLDQGMTAKAATAALAAGDLDCPPCTMPLNTAYDFTRRERTRRNQLSPLARELPTSPQEASDTLTQRLVSVHEQLIERLAQQNTEGTFDEALYRTVVKHHKDVLAGIRTYGQQFAPTQPKQEGDTQTQRLLEAAGGQQ